MLDKVIVFQEDLKRKKQWASSTKQSGKVLHYIKTNQDIKS